MAHVAFNNQIHSATGKVGVHGANAPKAAEAEHKQGTGHAVLQDASRQSSTQYAVMDKPSQNHNRATLTLAAPFKHREQQLQQ